MEHARLGRTGLAVSRLGLGTMTFGLQCDEDLSAAILDRAADAGVTFLDTADAYPYGGTLGTVGRSEEILGRWLKGRRDGFVVATKCGLPMGPGPLDRGGSRRYVLAAVEASLRRLQTDYLDLYLLHEPDPATPIDETLEALDRIVRSGKARYVGCSNFLAYRIAQALGRSDLRRLARFSAVQPRYNLLFREAERELLPLCVEEGLGVLAYNPLAGGLLTGKHAQGRAPTAGRFARSASYRERYWHGREFAAIEELRGVARDSGTSVTALALGWVLANPAVTCALVGASTPDQLGETIAAAERALDASAKARLDALSAEFRRGDAGR